MKHSPHKFSKAWDELNNSAIDIRDLPRSRNGKDCACKCIECNKPVVACQGYVNAWHFRHLNKSDCKGGPMTALHIIAQQLLAGDHTIKTNDGPISYTNAVLEAILLPSMFEADVRGVKADGGIFVIEICVTHKLDPAKIDFIRSQGLHAIEIDLSNVNPDINSIDLLQLLLNNTAIQTTIHSPFGPKPSLIQSIDSKNDSGGWLDELINLGLKIGAIYFCYKLITRLRRPSRRTRRYSTRNIR